jgi:hypothetical protein
VRDLTEAKNLLSTSFLNGNLANYSGNPDRVRPSRWAAAALLARVYLYTGNFANAEAQATEVISNNSLFTLSTLNNTFLKASGTNKEPIWQLQPVITGWNTQDARVFILPATGPANTVTYPAFLPNTLMDSFEVGDQRKLNWTKSVTVPSGTYYFAYKYKSATINAPVTEYVSVMRLAEQYLVRAEARAQQDKISEAQTDLNSIRGRAGLLPTLANNKIALLAAVQHERQVELFTEWGHRWFDLKRTGNVNTVMGIATPIKGGTWETTDQYYPIPLLELQRNPLLIQNPGY